MKTKKIMKYFLILLLSVVCLTACNDSKKTAEPTEDVKTPSSEVSDKTPVEKTPVETLEPTDPVETPKPTEPAETPEPTEPVETPTPTPVVEYTVTFKNYDGTFLYETKVVSGGIAEYLGAIPTKPAEGYLVYTFNGWDKNLTNITSDLEVTAIYRVTDNTPKEVIDYAGSVKLDFSTESLKEVVTLLWTFKVPWHWAYHGTLFSDGVAQFAFGFYSVMLTSTILGFVTMMLFKPRSWCVYCPMGTMTQMICQVKAK